LASDSFDLLNRQYIGHKDFSEKRKALETRCWLFC